MLDQKTVTIGEDKFTIQALPATKGLEVAFTIAHILKGAGQGFSEQYVMNVLDTHINVGQLVSGIMNAVDIKGTPQFIRDLVKSSIVSPDCDDEFYESRFAARYDDLADLLKEIILLNNYGDVIKKNLMPVIGLLFSTQDQSESGTASTP